MPRKAPRSPLLQKASPYPWRRDSRGDLIDRYGAAIYFQGSDSVLVENSPVLFEKLANIRELCLHSKNPQHTLSQILRLSDYTVRTLEAKDGVRPQTKEARRAAE